MTGGFERVGMTEKIKGWLTGGETAAPETTEAGASLDGGGASACEASPTPTDFDFTWDDAMSVTLSDGDLTEAMVDLTDATPDWPWDGEP